MIVDLARAVRVEDEVTRRGGLGLKRRGQELAGPCPRCGGHDRFAVSVRKQLFLCRSCNAGGDIVDLVQFLDGCSFGAAVRTLAGDKRAPISSRNTAPTSAQISSRSTDEANRTRALQIWADAVSITGTVAETYLHLRGLHDLPGANVLRLLKDCPFDGGRQVCLIALYRNIITDEPQAISRTAIGSSGNKIGRLSLGPTKGAAIKIDDDTDVELGLVVGEGLETTLAGRQLGFRPAWALGSSGAVKIFPVLSGVTALTVLQRPARRPRAT